MLRLKPGADFLATDGQGSFYDCVVTGESRGLCAFEVKARRFVERNKYHVHIAIAATKNHDRIEWFTEKATEIGIDCITPMECEHNERKKVNHDRLKKVAISAMKQSLKAWLPEVQPLTGFGEVLKSASDQKFIAHLDERPGVHLTKLVQKDCRSVVLIGPEGDFTSDEIAAAETRGFTKVQLSAHRLRTETAALVACHIINLAQES